jgi:hypothetical protein
LAKPTGAKIGKKSLQNFGDVKGTIRNDLQYAFIPGNVRRHRLISVTDLSLLPCHGTAKWYGREREGVGGNRKESDDS